MSRTRWRRDKSSHVNDVVLSYAFHERVGAERMSTDILGSCSVVPSPIPPLFILLSSLYSFITLLYIIPGIRN